MSTSFDTLPTEILHRIFDFLDTPTLISNVRRVSRRFRSLILTYNRYSVDFRRMSMAEFDALCQLVPRKQIVSTVLSGNGRTSTPFRTFRIFSSFKDLSSISLVDLPEHWIDIVQDLISRSSPRCLKLFLRDQFHSEPKHITQAFGAILRQPSLRRMEVDSIDNRLPTDTWSTTSSIEHLTLHAAISLRNLCALLENCPRLHTLVLKRSSYGTLADSSKRFDQLRSLTIEEIHVSVDELEPLLSCVPSLRRLKLHGRNVLFDAKRWEEFVEAHLPRLIDFQLDFHLRKPTLRTTEQLFQLLQPFRSWFWLKEKRWFVTCSHTMGHSTKTHLYSSPAFSPTMMASYPQPTNVPLADSYASMVDDQNVLHLPVSNALLSDLQRKRMTGDVPFYLQVNSIELLFKEEILTIPFDPLWSMVDVTHLVRIEFGPLRIAINNARLLTLLEQLFDRACNLSTLVFRPPCTITTAIIGILPVNLEELNIPVINQTQIEAILNRCKKLSLIKMILRSSLASAGIIQFDPTCAEASFVQLQEKNYPSKRMRR